MQRYHFRVGTSDPRKNDASFKAIDDCRRILVDAGYEDAEIVLRSSTRGPREGIALVIGLAKLLLSYPRSSVFVVQYPLRAINGIWAMPATLLKAKGCKLIAIVHDIESLREGLSERDLRREANILLNFDSLILHGESMERWIRNFGFAKPTTIIEAFDYLAAPCVGHDCSDRADRMSVCFAGNLKKSGFVHRLGELEGIEFHLYGDGYDNTVPKCDNVSWFGSFPPDQLPQHIHAEYGLVWDGASLSCDDSGGKYLQYNYPHKLSFYISCGMPVIVPSNSAIAGFVRDKGIGFAVDSLYSLPDMLKRVSDADTSRMRDAAHRMGELLREGYFLRAALRRLDLPA